MSKVNETATNRILVVDDDRLLIEEYLRCLGEEYEPDSATTTLSELEKVLFGDDTDESGAARFEVDTRNQGEEAVRAVEDALTTGKKYSIVFLDIRMPPGIDGIEAAKRIRDLDPDVNIVIVTGSVTAEVDNLDAEVPPADKIFFFKKPFHAAECRQLAAALCGKWHADMALRQANEDLENRVAERTAALHKLAYFDPVTRLPNHLMLLDELQAMIERSEESEGDSVVVVLDIERFSFLNETLGYDAGTELLRSIGNRLSRALSEEKQSERAIVGRFGADEFAVLMPGVENDTAIRELAEQVKTLVEEPFLIGGRDIFLKASMGVAWHPVHGRDAALVFRCAEAALHRSIRSLDGAITYYHSEMRYRARHQFDMEAEFRGAIENGQIKAFYQPQQCVRTGELAGVEALARWIRADGTVVLPNDFIPLSEEMGMSDLLFETILQNVCDEVASWRDDGGWDVPVSVNLSAHQLRNANLVGLVKKTLASRSVDRELINLELTETVLLEDLTIAQPILNDLSKLGVGIHIDDFGTGYSSLSYLAELPVKTIKIDRTFIAKLAESETNARVVQAIVALGKAMGLHIVAEGIETDQQYANVRRLGCDLVQGFFIAKPMSADRFRRWVDGHEDTQSLKHDSTIVEIDSARS
ncbi:MAG: EAL domain-containing protein [Woeseiaceae bacterium]|nr:EAL domain-containing protein [Woeseiaceae bacterium]NIP19530.1 EAL domain-containing protein [Woeseiaceae bacterium]NIS88485.1 EAL domain-containing protein [Woeseiaceae bacterium]